MAHSSSAPTAATKGNKKLDVNEQRLKELLQACCEAVEPGADCQQTASTIERLDCKLTTPAEPDRGLMIALALLAALLHWMQQRWVATEPCMRLMLAGGKLVLLQLAALSSNGTMSRCCWLLQCSWLWLRKDLLRLHLASHKQERAKVHSHLLNSQFSFALHAVSHIFGGENSASWPSWIVLLAWTVGSRRAADTASPAQQPGLWRHAAGVVLLVMFLASHQRAYALVKTVAYYAFAVVLLLVTVLVKLLYKLLAKVCRYVWQRVCQANRALVLWCRKCSECVAEVELKAFVVCAARGVYWLADVAGYVGHGFRATWRHVSKVFWLVVAVDLASLPWQFAALDPLDKGLALLLPLVQLLLAHAQSRLCVGSVFARKRQGAGVLRSMAQLHHCLCAGLAGNWFALTAAAIVSGGMLDAGTTAHTVDADAWAGWRLNAAPKVQLHLLAHFILTVVYAVLPTALGAMLAAPAAPAKLQRAMTLLMQVPCGCAHAAGAALGGASSGLRPVLVSCRRWLVPGCGGVVVLVQSLATGGMHALVRLCKAMHACETNMRACVRRCVSAVCRRFVSLPAAVLGPVAGAAATWAGAAAAAALGQQADMQAASEKADACSRKDQATAVAAAAAAAAVRQQQADSCAQLDCVVCLDAPRRVALLPCHHAVLCGDCFDDLQAQAQRVECGALACCPMCRAEVQSHVRGLILA